MGERGKMERWLYSRYSPNDYETVTFDMGDIMAECRAQDARSAAREALISELVALLDRGLQHIGNNEDRSLNLDHRVWRDEARAIIARTKQQEAKGA